MNCRSTRPTAISGRCLLLNTCHHFTSLKGKLQPRQCNTLADIPDLGNVRPDGRRSQLLDGIESFTQKVLSRNKHPSFLNEPLAVATIGATRAPGDEMIRQNIGYRNSRISNVRTAKENINDSPPSKQLGIHLWANSSKYTSRHSFKPNFKEQPFQQSSLANQSPRKNSQTSSSSIKSFTNDIYFNDDVVCPNCSEKFSLPANHFHCKGDSLPPNPQLNSRALVSMLSEAKLNEKRLAEKLRSFEEVMQKIRKENREMRLKISDLEFQTASNLQCQEALTLLDEERNHRRHLEQEVRLLTRDLTDVRAAYHDLVNNFNRNQLKGFHKQKSQNSETDGRSLESNKTSLVKTSVNFTQESQIVSNEFMILGSDASGLTLDSRFAGNSDIFNRNSIHSGVTDSDKIHKSIEFQMQRLHFLSGNFSSKVSPQSQPTYWADK
jgi:hypothetical protein